MALHISASAADNNEASGNITYQVSDEIVGVLHEGVLTVSGQGELPSYYNGDKPEWSSDADQIISIVIEEGITRIGVWSFYGLDHAESVSIPDSVTIMDGRCFCKCTSLKRVLLPPKLKYLNDCFWGCSGLSELIINNGCEEIMGNFLYECWNVKHLCIPASVTKISDYAFQNCNLETIEVAEGNPVYSSRNNMLLTDSGKKLIAAGSAAVTDYFVADGIEVIGGYAFDSKKGLKHADLTGVTVIEDGGFKGSGLEEIVIPDSVTSIGMYAFSGCPLTNIVFGNGIHELPYCGFAACNNLEEVCIPESITSSQANSFQLCKKLRKVTIESLKTVSYAMFAECPVLEEVIFGQGVERINRAAFRRCPSLKTITLPPNIKYVHDEAFDEGVMFINENSELVPYGREGGFILADDFTVTGERRYDLAFEILDAVNEERAAAGAEPLRMDPELMEAAMHRAAECSVLLSHTAPDGSSCFRTSDRMAGENIAAGSSTTAGTMTQWMNSKGHRENILRSEFTAMGVGVFVQDGKYYWTQTFGTHEIAADAERLPDQEITQEVHLASEQFSEAATGVGTIFSTGTAAVYSYSYSIRTASATMYQKETQQLDLIVTAQNGWGNTRLDRESVRWSSSDPDVAVVDETGLMKAVSPGNCMITAASTYRTVAELEVIVTASISNPDMILPSNMAILEEEAFAGISAVVVICPDELQQIDARAFADCRSLRMIYIPETTSVIASDAFENCRNLTIYGKKGSRAESYAGEKGFLFEEYSG